MKKPILGQILSNETLDTEYQKVYKNKGMAGVDKMTEKIEKSSKLWYALGNTNCNLSLDLINEKMMVEFDKSASQQ